MPPYRASIVLHIGPPAFACRLVASKHGSLELYARCHRQSLSVQFCLHSVFNTSHGKKFEIQFPFPRTCELLLVSICCNQSLHRTASAPVEQNSAVYLASKLGVRMNQVIKFTNCVCARQRHSSVAAQWAAIASLPRCLSAAPQRPTARPPMRPAMLTSLATLAASESGKKPPNSPAKSPTPLAWEEQVYEGHHYSLHTTTTTPDLAPIPPRHSPAPGRPTASPAPAPPAAPPPPPSATATPRGRAPTQRGTPLPGP